MVLSRLVGAEVRRKEDPRLITGSSMYVDDLSIPGMGYVAIVRSPHPHARIGAIDASAAKAMPGVIAVVTGDELAQYCGPLSGAAGEGGSGEEADYEQREDEAEESPPVWPIARDTVRWVGEAVAAVVAESRYQAEDAAEAVEVDYEVLPAVTDPEQAMEDGAPQIYPNVKNNIGAVWDRDHGDINAAFADAPVVAKARIRSQRLSGVPMEPRAVVATPDPLINGITVWTSTQAPHWNRNSIAEALGLPATRVRAVAPEVGGGFGVKIGAYQEDFIVAALAFTMRRPMKWIETRSENFLATNHGRDQWADVEIAGELDGRIRGLRMHVVQDLGGFPRGTDLAELTGRMSSGCYDIPHSSSAREASTPTRWRWAPTAAPAGRKPPTTSSAPLICLRTRRGWIRSRCAGAISSRRSRTATRPLPASATTQATTPRRSTTRSRSPVTRRCEREQAAARKNGRYLGIGLASYVEICGFGPFESATVRVETNGDVTIYTGISPHGQGQETSFAQIVGDGLGVPMEKIGVNHGDTLNTPQGNGTMGSRGLAVGGGAVVMAMDKVRDRAKAIAAHLLEAAAEDIEVVEGAFRVRGVPDRGLSLEEIAGKAYSDSLPAEFGAGLEATEYFRPDDETFPFGTHVAVVEVFPETGQVKLVRFVTVDDCGVIISPTLVRGQVHGGVAQGIGQALLEEIVYDASGELVTGTLNDYAIPRPSDFPQFETHHTETPTYLNPLGAKGIGEAATIGSTPAVANAVIDALEPWGITHLDVPFTPERVWRAIQGASVGAAAAD